MKSQLSLVFIISFTEISFVREDGKDNGKYTWGGEESEIQIWAIQTTYSGGKIICSFE